MSRKLSKKSRDTRKPSGKSLKKALAIARRESRTKKKVAASSPGPRPAKSGGKVSYHPLSMLLPMMGAADREATKADIAANGQLKAITLLDGQILDGRNRYEICMELGLEPKFEQFKSAWGDPLNYVYSSAVGRNLTDGQKACAAVHFDEKFSEQAKTRAQANLKQNANSNQPWPVGSELKVPNHTAPTKYDHVSVVEYKEDLITLVAISGPREGEKVTLPVDNFKQMKPEIHGVRSRDRAAGLFGVSGRYVQAAKLIKQSDPKLFDQVFNGQLTIPQAARSIHRSKKSNDLAARAEGVRLSFPLGLIHGDCLKEMEKMPAHSFRLAFADPPYNIGIDYGRGAKADQISEDKYQDWCQKWMSELHRVLSKDGTLWVLINDEHASMFDVELHSAGFTRRAWIKWYETFGVNCSKNFNRTSRHLFYCVKDESDFVWHASAFNRKSDRQKKYNDARANPAGKCWDDVWCEIPRLVDNSKERVPGFPTQLPLALVLPIIEGCSDRGDKVIDPFNGSGTTAHAAMLTGRIPTAIDIVQRNIEWTEMRLKAAIGDNDDIAVQAVEALNKQKAKGLA